MRKAYLGVLFLLLVDIKVFLKEITFFTTDDYMLTRRSEHLTTEASDEVSYFADNTKIGIIDKTQFLLMNIP